MKQLRQKARTASRASAGGSAKAMGRDDCQDFAPRITEVARVVKRQLGARGGDSDAYPR